MLPDDPWPRFGVSDSAAGRPDVVQAEARALIAAFDGEAAYLARNLTPGAELGCRPEAAMRTASTIKLLVLAELFRQAEDGTLALAASLPLLPEDRTYGSGILKDLAPDV